MKSVPTLPYGSSPWRSPRAVPPGAGRGHEPARGHGLFAERRQPVAGRDLRDAGVGAALRAPGRHRAAQHGRGAVRRDHPGRHLREHGAPARRPLDLRPADGPLPDGASRGAGDARGPGDPHRRGPRDRHHELDRRGRRLRVEADRHRGLRERAVGNDGLSREELYQGWSGRAPATLAADADWSHASGNGTVQFGDFHFDRADARAEWVAPGSQDGSVRRLPGELLRLAEPLHPVRFGRD
jgi:hypothetical protein